jgi:PAS domain S-box-containing protein
MTDDLSPGEARLSAALESVSDGVYAVDADWRFVIFNRAAEEYFGVPRSLVLGSKMWDVFPQGRGTPFEAACFAARDNGTVTTFETRSLLRPDRIVELRIAPMAPGGVAVSLIDITERKAAAEALSESQARLELATEAARLGVWEWRLGDELMVASPRARAIWGFAEDAPVTADAVEAVAHPEDRQALVDRLDRAFDPALRETGPFEYRVVWPDGQVRWVRGQAEAVFEDGENGPQVVRYVGTVEDITERKDDEERMQLLAGEVDHRANNLLALVQAMVSLATDEDTETFKANLTGRLAALSRSHQLLARGRWEGADLAGLLREELTPHDTGRAGRIILGGPRYALNPATAQALAMALHELTTNAAKHGALSTPEGSVSVVWRVERASGLIIDWAESGGPPVAPPTRRGFGGQLLTRALGGAMGGKVRLNWLPDGLRCRLTLPTA